MRHLAINLGMPLEILAYNMKILFRNILELLESIYGQGRSIYMVSLFLYDRPSLENP